MLTATQKAEIVFYLGYSATSIIPGSTDYDKILADRLNGLTAEAETLVVSLLAQIAAIRTKLNTSSSRMLVKRVGDIELNSGEHELLSTEYRRLLRDLSNLMGINMAGLASGGRMFGVCV